MYFMLMLHNLLTIVHIDKLFIIDRNTVLQIAILIVNTIMQWFFQAFCWRAWTVNIGDHLQIS